MDTKYLGPDDEAAFKDLAKQPKPANRIGMAECPQCKGYGGWHLRVDAYGPGKHFNAFCRNCDGAGWVPKSQADHIHEWEFDHRIATQCVLFRCSHRGCKATSVMDSSD